MLYTPNGFPEELNYGELRRYARRWAEGPFNPNTRKPAWQVPIERITFYRRKYHCGTAIYAVVFGLTDNEHSSTYQDARRRMWEYVPPIPIPEGGVDSLPHEDREVVRDHLWSVGLTRKKTTLSPEHQEIEKLVSACGMGTTIQDEGPGSLKRLLLLDETFGRLVYSEPRPKDGAYRKEWQFHVLFPREHLPETLDKRDASALYGDDGEWLTVDRLIRRWDLNDVEHLGDLIMKCDLDLYEKEPDLEIFKTVDKEQCQQAHYRNVVLKARKIVFRLEDVERAEQNQEETLRSTGEREKNDEQQGHQMEGTLDLRFSPETLKSYPPQILRLIQDASSEVEMIWKGMKSVRATLLQETYEEARECWQDAAMNYFDTYGKDAVKIVKREHVKDESLYYFGDSEKPLNERQFRRDFVGKLYQLLIHMHFPADLPEPAKPKAGYSVKKLFRLHRVQVRS